MSENPSSQPDRALTAARPIIGLAGGIGSGKSTVASMLADMDCVVDNADESVRRILQEPRVAEQLVAWWGSRVLDKLGGIDRRAIARIVFDDRAERERLEGLLHPLVHEKRLEDWSRYKDDPSVVAFVIDAPLVFEADIAGQCDAVIFIDSDLACRENRVKQNRGWPDGELPRREKNQWPLETKRNRSDYSIVNNGSIDELRDQVRLTLKQILTAHHLRSHSTANRGRAGV